MGQEAETAEPEVDEDGQVPLFADEELTDFRSQWDTLQARFVDEPRSAVEGADALVSDSSSGSRPASPTLAHVSRTRGSRAGKVRPRTYVSP